MAELLIQSETLEDIGDEIRAKTGGTAKLSPAQMVTEIRSIQAGDPNENLLKVNGNTLTEFSADITRVRMYMFAKCSNLTRLYLPNLTDIETYAFYQCGISAFSSENYVYASSNCFRECANLKTVVFKGGTQRLDTSMFERCNALQAVDCAMVGANGVNGGAFYNTPVIEALIIRSSEMAKLTVAIPASSALTTTGNIFVPAALVDTYKAATNWSAVASRILPIEGSAYETHYADGTPIS